MRDPWDGVPNAENDHAGGSTTLHSICRDNSDSDRITKIDDESDVM